MYIYRVIVRIEASVSQLIKFHAVVGYANGIRGGG